MLVSLTPTEVLTPSPLMEPIRHANISITPLQKPKKAVGRSKNMRPLMLSNAAWKILSLATLKRIKGKVDAFTGS